MTDKLAGKQIGLRDKQFWLGLLRILAFLVMLGAVLFAAAGSIRWVWGWAYLVMYALVVLPGVFLVRWDTELLEERTRAREGVHPADKWLAGVGSLFFPLGLLVVAGLDERFGWSADIAMPVQTAALVVAWCGYMVSTWAMAVNRFYARFVRIQRDRGHHVISSGPYGFVRHPGYLGLVIFCAASALALDSLWTLVPAGLFVALLFIRTGYEDRLLRAELDGYAAYAQQVRYRLIPGIW